MLTFIGYVVSLLILNMIMYHYIYLGLQCDLPSE